MRDANGDCETCEGTGLAYEDAYDLRGEHYTREITCPRCDGDGEVDDAETFSADDDYPASLNAEVSTEVGL